MRGGPFFRRDTHLPKAIHRLAGAEILQFEQLANFDLALLAVDGGIGHPPSPIEGLLARLHLNDGVAGDDLLGFGEGAVDDRALVAGELDAESLGAGLQPIGIEQHAGLHELPVKGCHIGHKLLPRHHAGLGIFGGLDQNHESHGSCLLQALVAFDPRTIPCPAFRQRRQIFSPSLAE